MVNPVGNYTMDFGIKSCLQPITLLFCFFFPGCVCGGRKRGGGDGLRVGECSFLQLIKQKSEIAKVSLREKSIIYSLAFSTKFALILLQTSV